MNIEQSLLLKIQFEQSKVKLRIDDSSITFKQLKLTLMQQFPIISSMDFNQILVTDQDEFAFQDEAIISKYLKNDDLIKLVKTNNPIIDIPLNDEKLQQIRDQEEDPMNLKMKILTQQTKADPIEAIVVIFDTSGSMQSPFFGDALLSRMGAVNAIFSAFADKTLAFELNHVIKLVTFANDVIDKCDFMSDFDKFIKLVDDSNPGGSTKCYDAMMYSVMSLLQIKQKYPNIILRIIALTDGEDNESKATPQEVTNLIREHKIIVDSFVVGSNCMMLKSITHASGGRCYCPQDINVALQLFEIETILSVSLRPNLKQEENNQNLNVNLNDFKDQPFDQDGIQAVQHQGVTQKIMTSKEIAEKFQKLDSQQNNPSQQSGSQVQSSASLKRILKELKEIIDKPQNEFKIFPVADDMNVWKVLLKGPKGSLYEGSIYQLIINFPKDYPFKPFQIRFLNRIFHCNVSEQGRICIDILRDMWSPSQTVSKVLIIIQELLTNPNSDNALDSNIASLMKHEPEKFQNTLKQYNKKYAAFSCDQLCQFVLGTSIQDQDPMYKEKHQEFENWINL